MAHMTISNAQEQQCSTTTTIAEKLRLNLDCWLLICRQLSITDLLQLAKVSIPLRELVRDYILPLSYKHIALNFKHVHLQSVDVRFILDAICATATQVLLTQIPDTYFVLLQSYCFPNVSAMHLSLEHPMKDCDLLAVSKVFPNVNSLKPHGHLSGLHMECFRNVMHLSLTCCHNMSVEAFRCVLSKMSLKSLECDVFTKKVAPLNSQELDKLGQIERISLNSFELAWLLHSKDGNALKNVKILIVTELSQLSNIGQFFEWISRTMPNEVLELEIANNQFIASYIEPIKYEFLANITNLKFINVRNIMSVFEDCSSFRALRKLSFYYCEATKEMDFSAFLTAAKQLKFVSFEECLFPEFNITEAYLKAAVIGRTKPLTLNWYSKILVNNLSQYERVSSMLKLTQRSYISTNYDPMTIKFVKPTADV